MLRGGLRIVPKSLRGGLTGCFLHCVNGKKSLRGTPEKSEKSLRGGPFRRGLRMLQPWLSFTFKFEEIKINYFNFEPILLPTVSLVKHTETGVPMSSITCSPFFT